MTHVTISHVSLVVMGWTVVIGYWLLGGSETEFPTDPVTDLRESGIGE